MTSTQTPTTLDDAKVGDTVMLMTGHGPARPIKVAHVTRTQIRIGSAQTGRSYYKTDGRQVGDRFGYSIRAVVPGELERAEREQAARALVNRIYAIVAPSPSPQRNRNLARLIAGPIENLEQALALLADSIRYEDDES